MKYTAVSGLSEFQECVLFNDWLETVQVIKQMTNHSPNELCKTKHDAINMKKIGMSPGFPDYHIAIPSTHYHGLFIEMKKAGKQNHKKNESQDGWIERLNNHGYLAKYAYGFEDAQKIVLDYMCDTNIKSLVRTL